MLREPLEKDSTQGWITLVICQGKPNDSSNLPRQNQLTPVIYQGFGQTGRHQGGTREAGNEAPGRQEP